jgi:type II secretory pathway pseudopilin PulG
MMRTQERGSALLIAVVVVLVVAVIGTGILRFTFREAAGATAMAREQSLVSCAESARQLLVSQFQALGLQPTSIAALNVPLDTSTGTSGARALGGHFDGAGVTGTTVTQVSYLPDNAFGPTNRVRDLSNIIAVAGQGGRPLKVVVHCQQAGSGTANSGRQLEVEFGVRFGL